MIWILAEQGARVVDECYVVVSVRSVESAEDGQRHPPRSVRLYRSRAHSGFTWRPDPRTCWSAISAAVCDTSAYQGSICLQSSRVLQETGPGEDPRRDPQRLDGVHRSRGGGGDPGNEAAVLGPVTPRSPLTVPPFEEASAGPGGLKASVVNDADVPHPQRHGIGHGDRGGAPSSPWGGQIFPGRPRFRVGAGSQG